VSLDEAYQNGRSGKSVFGQGYNSVFEVWSHGDGQEDRAAATNAQPQSSFIPSAPIIRSASKSYPGGGGYGGAVARGGNRIAKLFGLVFLSGFAFGFYDNWTHHAENSASTVVNVEDSLTTRWALALDSGKSDWWRGQPLLSSWRVFP